MLLPLFAEALVPNIRIRGIENVFSDDLLKWSIGTSIRVPSLVNLISNCAFRFAYIRLCDCLSRHKFPTLAMDFPVVYTEPRTDSMRWLDRE
jgi:hypothetical protein